jgi:DNA methylase
VKSNGGMGSLYRSQHELVFVFRHGRGPHRNNVQLGQYGCNRTNVWQYPGINSFSRGNDGEEGKLLTLHPTVKPVAMVADAIMDCTARGDIVLDAFLGSGTTIIAAERTGGTATGSSSILPTSICSSPGSRTSQESGPFMVKRLCPLLRCDANVRQLSGAQRKRREVPSVRRV